MTGCKYSRAVSFLHLETPLRSQVVFWFRIKKNDMLANETVHLHEQ